MGQIAVDNVDGVLVVSVDPENCAGLWREIEPRVDAAKGVVLDFTGTEYLNSMNIAAIIALRAKLEKLGKPLRLCGLSESIAAIFRVLKLERLFDLDLDRDQALAAVDG